MSRLMGVLAGLMFLLLETPAAAQEGEPGAGGPSFLFVRFASRSSLSLYAGYRLGPVDLVAGMLQNPRSSYREIMGGVAKGFGGANGSAVTLAPAIAWSNTGWYAQLYVVPGLRAGPVEIGGTLQLAAPLETEGVPAIYVSPANALVPVGGGLSAGITYFGAFEEGSGAAHAVGPAIRRAIPGGSITVEPVIGVAHAEDEVRVSLRASF